MLVITMQCIELQYLQFGKKTRRQGLTAPSETALQCTTIAARCSTTECRVQSDSESARSIPIGQQVWEKQLVASTRGEQRIG